MSFIEWVLSYWKPMTISLVTPKFNYTMKFKRGFITQFKVEKMKIHGLRMDTVFINEAADVNLNDLS